MEIALQTGSGGFLNRLAAYFIKIQIIGVINNIIIDDSSRVSYSSELAHMLLDT